MNRRNFISNAGNFFGFAIASSFLEKIPGFNELGHKREIPLKDEWEKVRAQFSLTDQYLFMSALLISSHPKIVTEAIDNYRKRLDKENVPYFRSMNRKKQNLAREAAAEYLGVEAKNIALTDSTTTGLATIYHGFNLKKNEEIILGANDYYSTYESIRLMAEKNGAKMVEVDLYSNTENATKERLVKAVTDAITKQTRVVALTWVHSGTGLKLPVRDITKEIKALNEKRNDNRQITVVVDGVHGFGIEDFTIDALGCDFFIAGCHKWLFGPRGTGIIWGNEAAWERVRPTIPSFLDPRAWSAWQNDEDLPSTNAAFMSPGGFKAFEHLWALTEAFEFHHTIGKNKIQERTHQLASQVKNGLQQIEGIILRTPIDTSLSSGIVCFDVEGMDPWELVNQLRERKIIASVTPYSSRHARLTPSIYNSEKEVEKVLAAMREIVGGGS
jgi:isopenicillin-N epimerase